MKSVSKKIGLGFVVVLSMVLVACGRDISSVDHAIEGHWTMTDAEMNGEPLAELLVSYSDWLGIAEEDVVTDENGEPQVDLDFYYSEDVLTIINSQNETTHVPYEVLSTDEENDTMRLEYTLQADGTNLVIQDDVTFIGEERESMNNAWNIVEVNLSPETTGESTELEQQFEELGQEIVRNLLQSAEFNLNFDFVSEEEPAALQE